MHRSTSISAMAVAALLTFAAMPAPAAGSEYRCREATDSIYLGRDTYAVRPDGKLMPIREGQPPPDLRYFKQPPK